MEECSVGEPGFVVTSGGNVMSDMWVMRGDKKSLLYKTI